MCEQNQNHPFAYVLLKATLGHRRSVRIVPVLLGIVLHLVDFQALIGTLIAL
jgi:hypothetical protein